MVISSHLPMLCIFGCLRYFLLCSYCLLHYLVCVCFTCVTLMLQLPDLCCKFNKRVLQCRVDFSLCRRKEPDDLRETSCVCNHLELFSISLSLTHTTHTHTHTRHSHSWVIDGWVALCQLLKQMLTHTPHHTHTPHNTLLTLFRLQASGRATGRRQCGFSGVEGQR